VAVVCASLPWFVKDMYSHAPTWKWPRLSKGNTYVIIFSQYQQDIRKAFDKVAHQVNVLTKINGCTNLVHPGMSKNTVVVFERPELIGPPKPRKPRVRKVADESRSQVRSLPEVPF